MKLTWYGHSCFLLTAENGTRILTDPCAPKTGYTLRDIACDIITSSHGHYDHNYVEAAAGNPAVLDAAGTYEIGGVRMTAIPSFHDAEGGAKRGANLIFRYEIDGLCVVHLGDLGHALPEETAALIGRPDILLSPVGGVFTVDADGAAQIDAQLRPKVFVPMHYQTPHLSFSLGTLETFLEKIKDRSVCALNGSTWEVTRSSLGENTAVVFDYVK